jgi:hypothetical protein
MACCAHVWICHVILTPFSRRLWRPRPRSKYIYSQCMNDDEINIYHYHVALKFKRRGGWHRCACWSVISNEVPCANEAFKSMVSRRAFFRNLWSRVLWIICIFISSSSFANSHAVCCFFLVFHNTVLRSRCLVWARETLSRIFVSTWSKILRQTFDGCFIRCTSAGRM